MRFIFVICALMAFASCKKPANSPCQEGKCDSNIECVAFWYRFEFRLIDKSTGEDLVFGNNPRYNINDIKLFLDAARIYPMYLFADSSAKKMLVMAARPQMYLQIKGTDVYQLTAEFRGESCCSARVKNLWQDGEMVCTCCNDIIPLAVR